MNAETRNAALRETRALVLASGFETLKLALGSDGLLRLVLDHPTRRVTVEDTARMNVRLRKALLARGVPTDDFRIEVESPGAARPLTEPKHYARFVGERVRVVRRGGGETAGRVVTGALEAADAQAIRVRPESGEPATIPYAEIAEARLDPILPF